ncbi:MAG TPA: thioredoxin [Bryobacteraceae bacterium]|nr:thioredoxin [Bryobacteraceae bacterium]
MNRYAIDQALATKLLRECAMIRICQNCGAKNRIPARYLAGTGKCGSCKSPLPPGAEPIEADTQLFDDVLRETRVPVLVDFWAEWCGPCRMAAPDLHAIAQEMAGRALVLKVNIDEHPELASRYGVQSIPNFLVLRNGHAVGQYTGVRPRAQMRGWLEAA